MLYSHLAAVPVCTAEKTTSTDLGSQIDPMNQEHYALTLQLAHGIGPKRARAIMETYPDAEALFKETPENAPPNWPSPSLWRELQQEASKTLERHEASNIQSLSVFHPSYPEALRNIPDAPVILFIKGTYCPSDARRIAVVGTRDPTPMGMDTTRALVEGLAPYGCTVVSGLARGIDAQAHRSALHLGLPTWAVLAHGLHTIHPKENQFLAEQILGAGGAWFSEWPMGTAPTPGAYPRRNRIIAGLSQGTLVIEAAIKSGAGITAHLAYQYDRGVYAVPGRLQDIRSQGCLDLLRRQVAHLILHPQHIAEDLGWSEPQKLDAIPNWPETHQKIWNVLAEGPMRLGAISEHTHLGPEKCLHALAEMMWVGDIRATHGWYARDGPMA